MLEIFVKIIKLEITKWLLDIDDDMNKDFSSVGDSSYRLIDFINMSWEVTLSAWATVYPDYCAPITQ